jgi:hypothetical protein
LAGRRCRARWRHDGGSAVPARQPVILGGWQWHLWGAVTALLPWTPGVSFAAPPLCCRSCASAEVPRLLAVLPLAAFTNTIPCRRCAVPLSRVHLAVRFLHTWSRPVCTTLPPSPVLHSFSGEIEISHSVGCRFLPHLAYVLRVHGENPGCCFIPLLILCIPGVCFYAHEEWVVLSLPLVITYAGNGSIICVGVVGLFPMVTYGIHCAPPVHHLCVGHTCTSLSNFLYKAVWQHQLSQLLNQRQLIVDFALV